VKAKRTTQEIFDAIERFRLCDSQSSSIEFLKNEFLRLIEDFAFMPVTLPKGIRLHRLRINNSDQDFENLGELWCPPKHLVTKLGRCNDIGDQVLYLSGGGHTALNELVPPIGSTVTCVEFELRKQIEFIEIGAIKHLQREIYFQQYADIHKKGLASYYGTSNMILLDFILKEFLVSEFTKKVKIGEEYLYKKTIAIAKGIFEMPTIVGIIFPSIKSRLNEINYAIPCHFAEELLIPKRIDVFQIVFPGVPHKIGFVLKKGSYKNLSFETPIVYESPREIERWAFRQKTTV